ncbi:MAG: hypothetical protein AAGI01_08640, partial [Myxococcota bacterium]
MPAAADSGGSAQRMSRLQQKAAVRWSACAGCSRQQQLGGAHVPNAADSSGSAERMCRMQQTAAVRWSAWAGCSRKQGLGGAHVPATGVTDPGPDAGRGACKVGQRPT